ncbi:MAG: LysR family transcriptional regulator [Xanthobacteraceae bacterium]|jgi:DNA-binding transcriptional LysR family regulator
MNLRSVDLNLLVVLDALLGERHVTKASERIGLSQPAMSNALSRLRGMFGDDLLVRTATGMTPTPRANELVEPLRQVLRQVERVLESDAAFDPVTSNRTFNIRMSDILACLWLPPLMARQVENSKVAFNVVHLPPAHTIDALDRDEIDLAISTGLDHSSSIRSLKLLSDRMVCVMRKKHPIGGRRFSFDTFMAQQHMNVSMSPLDQRFADEALAKLGKRRNTVLNVPHWLLAPYILKKTDLLAIMPGHLATVLMDDDLQMRDVPFDSAPFDWMLYWHRRNDRSNANTWLRNEFSAVVESNH